MDRHATEECPLLMQSVVQAASDTPPWLPVQRRAGTGAPGGKVVICFPPAGAGAGFFRDWSASLPGHRIVPVQLPGREERFGEPPMEDAREIAAGVAEAIRREGWERPYLLGYSFGALLAFETGLALERDGIPLSGVITMARGAPQLAAQTSVADLPDAAFLDYVRSLGGLPPEFDEMPELAELMIPVMRADFRANDNYARLPGARLDCPLTTIAGTGDAATAGGRDTAWADCATTPHRLMHVDGGHFFVFEKKQTTFASIDDVLTYAGRVVGEADGSTE